jgi:branched-chain amino acid transport system substrate-binding protein
VISLRALPACVCAVLSIGLLASTSATAGDAVPLSRAATSTITIGAAQDISAGWTALGRASRVTLQLAAADTNAALARQGSSTRVRLRIVDTKGTTAGAVAAVRQLAGLGARFIIGPPTSSGVRAVRREAGRLGVVVISQGSTAHSLAIPGDNVFRFVPDDVREGEAMVALLRRRGVDAIVPVWRRDPGNAGLATSVRRLFTAAGGKVSRGASYGESPRSFSPVVSSIATQASALRARGARHVAVYLAAFDEVVDLFRVAALSPPVAALPWYGSDGVALTTRLLGDSQAAAFARHVGYPNPTVGLPDDVLRRAGALVRRTRARLGHNPDALALTAYDALRIAVAAQQHAGPGAASLRSALTAAANGYTGVTGTMLLNAAGDRAYGSFDFWSVCPTGRKFRWKRTAEYIARSPRPGRITGSGRC